MIGRRGLVGVGVALLLCASACSGAGARAAATDPAPSTTTASVPASYVVADLGSCPAHDPTTSPAELNRGVVGLGKRLVPIAALNLRICEYDSSWTSGNDVVPGRLVHSARLRPAATMQFEAETNRQPTDNPGPLGCTGPGGGVLFGALTFANDTQQVSLTLQVGACGAPVLTNGYHVAYPMSAWTIDLSTLTGRNG